jgi:hypothetical protein
MSGHSRPHRGGPRASLGLGPLGSLGARARARCWAQVRCRCRCRGAANHNHPQHPEARSQKPEEVLGGLRGPWPAAGPPTPCSVPRACGWLCSGLWVYGLSAAAPLSALRSPPTADRPAVGSGQSCFVRRMPRVRERRDRHVYRRGRFGNGKAQWTAGKSRYPSQRRGGGRNCGSTMN